MHFISHFSCNKNIVCPMELFVCVCDGRVFMKKWQDNRKVIIKVPQTFTVKEPTIFCI